MSSNNITTADPIRINRVYSYKVIKEVLASDLGANFELDQSHLNDFFVIKSRSQYDEPRLIRESVFFLKHELARTPILILSLQTIENKLISSKKNEQI